MKIIVVSAHPDDVELSCSGTLLRLQDQGADITSIIAVAPSAEDNANRSKEIVERELTNSYKLSNFKLKVFDTDVHANGRPNLVANNITMTKLSELFDSCDIAILPNPEDYHQDHVTTYQLAFPLARKRAKEVWLMQSIPYCHYYKSNTANLFVDVSDQWNRKQQLLECYPSYIDHDMINQVKLSNQYWGSRTKCDLAEAFTIAYKHV